MCRPIVYHIELFSFFSRNNFQQWKHKNAEVFLEYVHRFFFRFQHLVSFRQRCSFYNKNFFLSFQKHQPTLKNSSTTAPTTSSARKFRLQTQHQQLSEDALSNNSTLELNDELHQVKCLNRHSYNGSSNYRTFEQQQQQLQELQKHAQHQTKSTEALGVLLQYLVYDVSNTHSQPLSLSCYAVSKDRIYYFPFFKPSTLLIGAVDLLLKTVISFVGDDGQLNWYVQNSTRSFLAELSTFVYYWFIEALIHLSKNIQFHLLADSL